MSPKRENPDKTQIKEVKRERGREREECIRERKKKTEKWARPTQRGEARSRGGAESIGRRRWGGVGREGRQRIDKESVRGLPRDEREGETEVGGEIQTKPKASGGCISSNHGFIGNKFVVFTGNNYT